MSNPSDSDLRQFTVTAREALERAAEALEEAEHPIDELVIAQELDMKEWKGL